ncbi:GRB2-associated-binding protein 2-like [Pollicipes pollicipes]|uniref:GRB2-associated-binding protein 2-like n=1 Tax=Pollicipes pollicipes TaxID=41117 RepID=UPI001884D7C6|nr:GRB2-associated-binding protein 2-like [Pollicipes pollicipes]
MLTNARIGRGMHLDLVPSPAALSPAAGMEEAEVVNEGWLIKSPPQKRFPRAKWRRRYFLLRRSGALPAQYVLEYFSDESKRKLKGKIELDQCEQVDAGLTLDSRKHQYDFMFDIRTPKRTFYLAAESKALMERWVDCICRVCGLKVYPRDGNDDGSAPPPAPDSSPLPRAADAGSEADDSDSPPVSPSSPSSVSGPYIPITRCWITLSGRALTAGAGGQVNWETYPGQSQHTRSNSMPETVKGGVNKAEQLKQGPPRPPKPPHLQGQEAASTHNYQNFEELRSPRLSDTESATPRTPTTVPADDMYDFPRPLDRTSGRRRNCYAGAAPGQIFNYDFSERPPPAPVVNRTLKPRKAYHYTDGGRPLHEVQYLDLDLGETGETGSPRSPAKTPLGREASTGTVYKTVDFVKTEAFNKTRQSVELERTKTDGPAPLSRSSVDAFGI